MHPTFVKLFIERSQSGLGGNKGLDHLPLNQARQVSAATAGRLIWRGTPGGLPRFTAKVRESARLLSCAVSDYGRVDHGRLDVVSVEAVEDPGSVLELAARVAVQDRVLDRQRALVVVHHAEDGAAALAGAV